MQNTLSEAWQALLGSEFDKPYMQQLQGFLQQQEQAEQTLYPPAGMVFNAFKHCAPADIKVVILGQDPYHGPGQAHGLCFSVPEAVKIPPSLGNIYKELQADIGMDIPSHGNLESWAEQGVLLLNSVLTVTAGQAASHQKRGWEPFTDQVIRLLNERCEHLVFLLWGSYAQQKAAFVNQDKHLVLTAPHPSPLSAHRGFFGCQHFSQANRWLQQQGLEPIAWHSVLDKQPTQISFF